MIYRDSYMHHTFKGIYTKFRGDNGRISNVLYENIYIEVMVLIGMVNMISIFMNFWVKIF